MATPPVTELFAASQSFPLQREPESHLHQRVDGGPVRHEWAVIQRAIAGDSEALEDLFTRHRQKLLRVAFRVLHNREDAEDALQDALLNAYQNLGTFQGQSQFSTWLTRIVLNAALMKRRRERVRLHASLEEKRGNGVTFEQILADARPTPEQVCVQVQNRLLVTELLLRLAPTIRAALHLRYVHGLTLVQAARAAGVSLAAMKTRLFRGRQQLAWQVSEVFAAGGRGKVTQTRQQRAAQSRQTGRIKP